MKRLLSFLTVLVLAISIASVSTFSFIINAQTNDKATKTAANSLIAGDVNDDGELNGKDCVAIMRYIKGDNININVDTADVNGDEKLNNKDYVLMVRYLNGWDVTLTPPQDDDGGIDLPIDKWE
ncbi:MAG: dockerin type I repeat-containing protein [Clostridia bacterium]|nr:dockerin type I repeat-containing protein [Clostridia bacterium]